MTLLNLFDLYTIALANVSELAADRKCQGLLKGRPRHTWGGPGICNLQRVLTEQIMGFTIAEFN